ncbi:zinc uptake protein ZrgA [Vibrio ostreicida]|uniref:zinc uptake protein ZrgA n=1 Tax=Vibrio ostreicida TaxID=526588 RepID=UPI003B5A80EB
MHSIRKIAIVVSLTFSTAALANQEFRQHEAHMHGHVELNIAQEGDELLLDIHAPSSDLLGFEHAPNNDQQHDILDKALTRLGNADSLFTLTPSAECKLVRHVVTHTLDGKEDENKSCQDGQDCYHGDSDSHQKHRYGHETKHSEFSVTYHYRCDNPSELSEISTQWFTHFQTTKYISVNLMKDKAQSVTELVASHTKIYL